MAKFIIECPKCGKYTEASSGLFGTGLFGTKKIECVCGYTIDAKADRFTSRTCAHCGNNVIFDQRKGADAVCPVCHEKINTPESMANLLEFTCPSCSCNLSADKNAAEYTCPLCDTKIDVQKQIGKEKIKNKGLASVIKYEGGNDVFVWKHPIEDFNLGSQLIVHETQEAVFFKDGKALDTFGGGRYTLATQNLPVLEELYKLPLSSDDVFHSEIYFINLTTQMGIKWGTDSKVRMFDPASGLHVELGACGNFNLRVSNARKLLMKIVGTATSLEQNEIAGTGMPLAKSNSKFKALIMTAVKSNLARAIKEANINILEIDAYLDILSDKMRDVINETLDEYGLTMPEFYITTIMTPDDNPDFIRLKKQFADRTLKVREEEILKAEAEAAQSRKMVEAQTEAELIKIKAQAEAEAYRTQAIAEAEEMRMKGFTYQQETARQVGMEAMKNGLGGEGGGGAIGDVAGLGVALGAMGGVMNMTRDALDPAMAAMSGAAAPSQGGWNCSCGARNITSNFCPDCGGKKPVPEAADTWDCPCGVKGITSKFCPDCGAKKPEGWTCSCGTANIMSRFCPNCGEKKPEPPSTWNCSCGAKDITSKFCPECGQPKGE